MIGNQIRTIRINKGISQKELALRMSMNQCQISKIEKNNRKVNANEIPCFAKSLGVPTAELLEPNKPE